MLSPRCNYYPAPSECKTLTPPNQFLTSPLSSPRSRYQHWSSEAPKPALPRSVGERALVSMRAERASDIPDSLPKSKAGETVG